MESAGEDPYLASAFAAARVRGFQGDDLRADDTVLACAKHLAGYGALDAGREYNTVNVSETHLREVHLPPFEAAVDAGVASVMNAFNTLERIPATQSEWLVRGVLREEFGFEGFLVTDWNTVGELIEHGTVADEREAARAVIEAGAEMDMVSRIVEQHLPDLVEDGEVDETTLDEAVRHVLVAKAAIGLFEDPYRYFDEDRCDQRILTDDHRETARDVARDAIVLLQNDGTLPVDPGADVAVIGGLADSAEDVLGNWQCAGDSEAAVSLRTGIDARATGAVTYEQGYETPGSATAASVEAAVESVEEADVALVVVGETCDMSGEGESRARLDLPGDQRDVLQAVHGTGTPTVAVLMNGRPLPIEWMADEVPTILETWHLGTEAGHAVADVVFGDHDPSVACR